ncbi:MAG: peptidoglycan-binding protein [Leptolyngbyaceae cyanobacterium SM2_5_2]|nr:peptidoglycan-binding protein [Leptolyngbyaceae cyanobacterium SM2_5_2]
MDHAPAFDAEPLAMDQPATEPLRQRSDPYQSIILNYCTLALQPELSAADEAAMGDILAQSVDDPLLSFWLDEADHWIGHRLGLMPESTLKQQQGKLRRQLGKTWIDAFLDDLQQRTKALQAYLKRAGFYSGAIDGVMGPRTVLAVESLKQQEPEALSLEMLMGNFSH